MWKRNENRGLHKTDLKTKIKTKLGGRDKCMGLWGGGCAGKKFVVKRRVQPRRREENRGGNLFRMPREKSKAGLCPKKLNLGVDRGKSPRKRSGGNTEARKGKRKSGSVNGYFHADERRGPARN